MHLHHAIQSCTFDISHRATRLFIDNLTKADHREIFCKSALAKSIIGIFRSIRIDANNTPIV